MAVAAAPVPWYRWLKATLFGLLAANAAGFALFGRASEAVDSLAWLVLLVLLEVETAYPDRVHARHAAALVRGARIAAGFAVTGAALTFVYEREWLDAGNAGLWIAMVVLLEIEVRFLAAVERHRAAFAAAAGVLYAGMAALVLVWAWRGEWFDAYDALLWLVAFVALEVNVLQISRGAGRDGAAR